MNIERVLLIEPAAPSGHVYSMVKMPRLGLPLLATQLKEEGYAVDWIYGSGQDIKVSQITAADVVGISTTTSTCREAYNIANVARNKGIPVVLGGVHATFMPEEALKHCDYVCRGEADQTFLALLECIAAGREPEAVPGVSFRRQGEAVHNPLPAKVDFRASAIPDLHLSGNRRISTYPVMTSRGCPFNCTFCTVTQMFGHRYRCRDEEQVLEELSRYKGKSVFFSDDNFTADLARSKSLLAKMLERNILPKWWGAQVRTDAAKDEELLRLMRQANCGNVYVGMESINPDTLAAFNKRQSVEDIEYCVEGFHRHRIKVHGMFVFGADEDTVETIRKTVDFALRTGIDTVQFMVLVPFPGTPLYERMDAEGRLLTKNWNYYDGHHVVFRPQQMTAHQLQEETIRAFKKFYSSRHFAANLAVTGFSSAVYRAAGNYLVRKWQRQNGWYQQYLQALTENLPEPGGVEKKIRKVSLGKQLQMYVSQFREGVAVELQGRLSQASLNKTLNALQETLPENVRSLKINASGLAFVSEEVAKRFIVRLNNWAAQAYNIEVQVPDYQMLLQVLERYDLGVPHFDFG